MKYFTIILAVINLTTFWVGAGYAGAVTTSTPSNTDPSAPTIPVFIEGTLVNSDGQPINEGFVMLQGNSQINALTCSDGRFRMEGLAWAMPDVLLASSAGKEVCQIKLDRTQVKGLVIKLQQQDPSFTKIEMGMALKIGWVTIYADHRTRPLTDGERECLQAYDDFFKNRGYGIMSKMLKEAPLTDDEKRYEYILASQIWCRSTSVDPTDTDLQAEKQYYEAVHKEYFRITLKAIRRLRLTEDDVHMLRLFVAMFQGTGMDPTSIDFSHEMGTFTFPHPTPGAMLPFDVPLLLTSPLLSSSVWNNYTSLCATAHLRLEGIWTLLDAYWKWRIQGENTLSMSPLEEWKQHYWQDWYHVTSVNELVKKADGKPVYLVCDNFADLTYPGFYTRQAEYFRRAYHGLVDIYETSQTSGYPYLDTWIDEWTCYGPNPKRDPVAGLDCPRWEEDNYTPLRHARTDKLVAMTRLPWVSGETLLDIPRYSSFLDDQVSLHNIILLDRDAKLALPYCSPVCWTLVTTRYFSDNESVGTYTRQGDEDYANSLIYEQILRGVIANGGRIDPKIYDKVLIQYPDTFTAKDDLFVVKSVDKLSGIIHAGWFDPGNEDARIKGAGWGSNPNFGGQSQGDFLFKVNPGTRYVGRFKNGDSSWVQPAPEEVVVPQGMEYHLLKLDDLKPGEKFYITLRFPKPFPVFDMSTLLKRQGDVSAASEEERKQRPTFFDMSKYDGKELSVERITNYLSLDCYYGEGVNFMPLYGRIVAKEDNVITVKIDQNEVREMSGYRFWKEEEAAGRPVDDGAKWFWPTLKRWGDGTDEDRAYRFKIDGATDVYKNGRTAEANDVAVGDYVFVEYERWWETQNLQKEIILPEWLQASSPIEKSQ
jgi:hypothetical protein